MAASSCMLPDLIRPAVAICMLFLGTLLAGEAGGSYPMRERVLCDDAIGVALRYPYSWQPDEQYGTTLRAKRGRTSAGVIMREVTINGVKVMVPMDGPRTQPMPELRLFSATTATGPAAATPEPLEQIGDREARARMTWKAFDYYRTDVRPHADRKWAMEGITAVIGQGSTACALVVRHGDRVSGIVLRGSQTDLDNARIIDSFEILSSAQKPRPGANPRAKPPRRMTWREDRTRNGFVFDTDGRALKAQGSAKPAPWSKAWEVETENYRIMGNASPARLLQHAAYYEALFRAYSAVYQPERMPPYKFEVHVFNTADDFEGGAQEWIDPGFRVRGNGGIIGGFFVPSLLSLWVYEESGKLGGSDFTVEHVSAHECSHQFLHIATNGNEAVPTWINEGLAVFFEAGTFRGGEFVINPPTERIQILKDYYNRFKAPMMPLDQYIDHGGHISAGMYSEVYAMTHFWIFGQGKEGITRFRAYWQALKAGEDGAKAFERIFLEDMIKNFGSRSEAVKAWEKALLEYVKRKTKWETGT